MKQKHCSKEWGFEKFVAKKTGRFVDAKTHKKKHLLKILKGKDTTELKSLEANTQTKHLPEKNS